MVYRRRDLDFFFFFSIKEESMIVKRLKPEEIDRWYYNNLCRDFPENEVKPLDNIKELMKKNKYDVYTYMSENDEIMGYATIWKAPGFQTFLLDYLGVPEHGRNCGMGAKILGDIRNQVVRTELELDTGIDVNKIIILLESETPEDKNDPENNIRRRRVGFYQRNGYIKIYEMGTCGVRFDAMVYKNPPDDMGRVMREMKGIYGPERTDVIVPLGRDEDPPLPFWMEKSF